MKCRLLLNIVVRERATVFELFPSEDQPLLVWRDAFLVLNFGLDVINCVRGFNIQGDGLACQSLDKDLHSTTKTQDKMKGRLLLDVVVRESATVFELFPSED